MEKVEKLVRKSNFRVLDWLVVFFLRIVFRKENKTILSGLGKLI